MLRVVFISYGKVWATFVPADIKRSSIAEINAGYGMLLRLGIGADSFLRHLVINDNLVTIEIQRHASSRLVLCSDN